MLHTISFLLIVLFSFFQFQELPIQSGSSAHLIGSCEGCEAIFEFGDRKLSPTDTLSDFRDPGAKLKISGKVYHTNGITPANEVIIYIYHTDQTGIYPTRGDERGWARRHGYIRGWVKTDTTGQYTFYTLRPGTYPNRNEPAHIHITLLEPDGKYYWIDSYYFADDPLLSEEKRLASNVRGGNSNVLQLKAEDHIFAGKRDIILGMNVPGYK